MKTNTLLSMPNRKISKNTALDPFVSLVDHYITNILYHIHMYDDYSCRKQPSFVQGS